MKNVAQGATSTTPNHVAPRPTREIAALRLAGSICHQVIPPANTASATTPVATFPATPLSSSIRTELYASRGGSGRYKSVRFPNPPSDNPVLARAGGCVDQVLQGLTVKWPIP